MPARQKLKQALAATAALALLISLPLPASSAGATAPTGPEGTPRLPLIVVRIGGPANVLHAGETLFPPTAGIPADAAYVERFHRHARDLSLKGPLTAIRSGGAIALVSSGQAANAVVLPVDGSEIAWIAASLELTKERFERLNDKLEKNDFLGAHAELTALFDRASATPALGEPRTLQARLQNAPVPEARRIAAAESPELSALLLTRIRGQVRGKKGIW